MRSSNFFPEARRETSLVALALAVVILSGWQVAEPDPELGEIDFPTSCSEQAQEHLDRGVAMLHHMMYPDARTAFERAVEVEEGCAMAHWGLAMSYFQPFWGEGDIEAGRPPAEQAVALSPSTERERAYAEAVLAFYEEDDVEYGQRIQSWEAAMSALHESFPDDQEAAAFFALAHISVAPQDPAHQQQAQAIVEEVLEEEPRHPGAIHYAIHVNDVEARADEGVEYAGRYDDIAPSVPHALHMPSHIYVRMGDWEEVIEWNRRSADAALEHPAGDDVSLHYPHALDYLMYGYLQEGRDEDAGEVLEELDSHENFEPGVASAYALAAIPARWHVERRDWEGAAELEPRVPDDFPWDDFPESEAMTHFARGLGQARTGDVEGARASMERLEELQSRALEVWGDDYWANEIQVKREGVAAWTALAEGRVEEAVETMEAAAEHAAEMGKHPVTPGDLQPAEELLGDLFMEVDRPEEALRAYEASLETWPGRYHTLLGAARAADRVGDEQAALDYYEELVELGEEADPGREGFSEAEDRAL